MTRIRSNGRRFGLAVLVSLLVVACGTTPAPNFKGRWQPVNHFDDVPVAIPLSQAYVYAPSPLDRTLKAMLTRWAKDSRMTLSYLHGSDYTLHGPIAGIRTPSLQRAVGELNAAYAAYGVSISADAVQITVRGGSAEPIADAVAAP